MNYEQKYKAALKRAREYWETDNDNTLDIKAKGTMEFLFPELKRNEYESTRKRIIALVNAHGQGKFKESMLAWLEKLKVFTEHGDGLYHFANSEFTYIGNPTWDNVSFLEKQGEPLNEPVFDRSNEMYQAISSGLCDVVGEFGWSDFGGIPIEEILSWLEKQGQKPFDYENATIVQKDFSPNEKPKFNIGDWIVSDKTHISNDYRLCKVVGISDGCYTIQTIGGLKGYNTFKEWENDYHLCSELKKLKGE